MAPICVVNRRHAYLEKALSEAQGVPVHCIDFRGLATTPLWDFGNYQALIRAGYEKACMEMAARPWVVRPGYVLSVPSAEKQAA